MKDRYVGNVDDFGKLALLQQLMEGRRLAVCWYMTGPHDEAPPHHDRSFSYLHRPDEFRHLAPGIFDALKALVNDTPADLRRLKRLETSGLLEASVFHGRVVPKRASSREVWAKELVQSVSEADLVFLDPDNGIQGKRLTRKHVAMFELSALRRPDRTLVIAQRQLGRRAGVLAQELQSLGCQRVELIRFRLISSRFYVVADHDAAMSERIASFARKWGNWVKIYGF
jgi:hypothetical protein